MNHRAVTWVRTSELPDRKPEEKAMKLALPTLPLTVLAPLVLAFPLLTLPVRGAGQAVVYAVAPTADGPMELVMDLYRPAEGPVNGAVVLAHGGGFTGGSRTLGENADYGEALASRGYLAAAISYRLLGDEPVVEAEWADEYARTVLAHDDPRLVGAVEQLGEGFATAVAAAAVDQAAAVAWLRERAGELGFDPGNVALFGASAGAITALTLAYAMDLYGAEDVDVAAVIDLRGLFLLPEGAPVPFDEDGPPLMILHGEDDQRVPLGDAEQVFRLAREGGTPVQLHVAPGVGHELGGAGLLARRLDRERTVLDQIDAFLGAAFAGTPDPVTSLRTRLLPARSEGVHPPDTAQDARPAPGQDREFCVELAAAVRALVDAVEEESPFVASLYGLAKPMLLAHELDAPQRVDWSYWPRARAGLPLGLMTAEQRVLTHRILRLLLSAKGYLQVNHVMLLEELLIHEETAGFQRGAEDYHVAVFGEPDPDGAWALRFEGHHVSLNVTLLPDRVAVTPSFLGAAPAPVPAGVRAGFTPLGHEQRWGFRLLESLDPGQRAAAVLGDEAPSEIVSTQFQREPGKWARWRERLSPDGVAGSTFDDGQRRLLRRLLLEVAGTYPDEVSRPLVEALDLDGLAFAWLGATEPGAPHYFRIQGDDFVYELDAAGEGGRHVHSVWRQREGDFGRDILEEHYRERTHDHRVTPRPARSRRGGVRRKPGASSSRGARPVPPSCRSSPPKPTYGSPTRARNPKLGPVLQDHDVVSVEVRLHFADEAQIHEGGAVDPEKTLVVQLALERLHRPSYPVGSPLRVHAQIVAARLDPPDPVPRYEMRSVPLAE
jgi:acetyl esterase/lipase